MNIPPSSLRGRPYYRLSVALWCKPYVDKLLSNKQTLLISPGDCEGIKVATIHNRLMYGVKFLAENEPFIRDYLPQRHHVSIKVRDNGVYLEYNEYGLRSRHNPQINSTIVASEKAVSIIGNFQQWLETAKKDDIYNSTSAYNGLIQLSESDEATLVSLCAQLGMELEVNMAEGKFRVMR